MVWYLAQTNGKQCLLLLCFFWLSPCVFGFSIPGLCRSPIFTWLHFYTSSLKALSQLLESHQRFQKLHHFLLWEMLCVLLKYFRVSTKQKLRGGWCEELSRRANTSICVDGRALGHLSASLGPCQCQGKHWTVSAVCLRGRDKPFKVTCLYFIFNSFPVTSVTAKGEFKRPFRKKAKVNKTKSMGEGGSRPLFEAKFHLWNLFISLTSRQQFLLACQRIFGYFSPPEYITGVSSSPSLLQKQYCH